MFEEAEQIRAGLGGPSGVFLGYHGQTALRLESDSPLITFGGAGTGKLSTVLGYNLCGMRTRNGWTAPRRMYMNDPRGEGAATAIHNHVCLGKAALCINAFRLHGLPAHKFNVWDFLRSISPTFHVDVKWAVSNLLPLSGKEPYWDLRARDWCEALIRHYVVRHGGITMPAFFDLMNSIEDPVAWADIAEAMLNSHEGDVRRVASEMDSKRETSPREHGAVLGVIFNAIGALSIPAVREMLGGSDFSLEILCKEDCTIFNVTPAEFSALLAGIQRAIISTLILYKSRHPSAPRILLAIDEANTLGPGFEALLHGYTYGRGMGIRMWTFWQDTQQIVRNFGREALSGFIGSSQVRQFLTPRDLDTARFVSDMLGVQTLEYDLSLDQAAAHRNKVHIARELLAGGDPFELGLNYAQQARAAINRTKQARLLQTPDEVLNAPEDSQYLFISGLGLKPIFANKYPYWTRAECAGAYGCNPYHPPADRVRIKTRFGMKWARVITERVPQRYAHLPQYASGYWQYIEGYRP